MAIVATGSIVFWEGGSLWVFDVPERAANPLSTAAHAHHAIQITLALDGAFQLHFADRSLPGPGVIIAADVEHTFEPRGQIAHLFVEPESPLGRALADRFLRKSPFAKLESAELARASEIAAAFGARNRKALGEAGRALLNDLTGSVAITQPDQRVRKLIAWAAANLVRPIGMREAAAHIALSPSRASHLFVEQTGISFRTYLLWLRLMRAVDEHARGASLTEAAMEGGFADSAHLSRTFRRMFGLPASAMEIT